MLVRQSSPSQHTTVTIAGVPVGGPSMVVIAGPCAAESETQLRTVAECLTRLDIRLLRAGVYKPRTSPYSFQGLQDEGLQLLHDIKRAYGLGIVSEVMSVAHLERACEVFDCFQVGSRNMQNFELLKALGQVRKPVLLKRGLAATIEELLGAAEYILAGGNQQVILCERGIRSFDPSTRNVLDLGAVALLKRLTHLPVIVDPSHATGRRELVIPAARAAVAVGADGLIVECHPVPQQSVSDAAQALSLDELEQLVCETARVAQAVGRQLPCPVERAA
jgi:3-deoxy-7-phosphoheptulonate synthase